MAGHTIGSAFLGGIQAVQGANQNRFDNAYRNRVLDLDERTLQERIRQFDLAQKADDRATTLAEQQFELDERKQKEVERSALATEKNFADRTGVMQRAADIDQGRLEFDQDKEATEQKQRLETNRVGRLLPFMNADFTGLDPKFFERDQNGRLVNKTEIFDLINQNSALLISETAPGQFVDKEVGGLDYDRDTDEVRLLLRDKNTDGELAPATVNGTNQASDAVVTLPSSAFNDYVSRQFRTNTLANYDRSEFNLSGARAVNALGAARLAQQEKEIEDAVTAKIQQGGNVGMLRQGLQILADTENDPEGRADFLRTVGIDPQQFAKPVETRDPSSEFLGPDTPLRDPLLRGSGGGSDAYAAMNRTQSGGTNPFMSSGGEGFKTKYPNLVAELQSNFDQERTLQQNARLPVAERTAKVQELQTRRQELLDNIGDEVSSRKVARQNYESYLNQKAMSQPQRDKLLGEYDSYIKQLEDYLPQEEKVTVDVATEFSRLVDMGEEAVRAGVENGTLPITSDQIANIRKLLTEKGVRTATDLATQNTTTQFAALAAAMASSKDATVSNTLLKSARNLAETGSMSMTRKEQLDAMDAAQDNQRAEREFDREGQIQVADRQADIRESIQTNVAPVQAELNEEFAVTRPTDISGLTSAQIEARERLPRATLRDRVVTSFSDGAAAKALVGLRDSNKSAQERQAFTQVFNRAATAGVAALISRNRDAGFDAQDIFETVLPDFVMEGAQAIGLADTPLPARNVRTTEENFDTLEVQVDSDGVPTIFRIKNPEGGVYRGRVTNRELRTVFGNTAYQVFLQQLAAKGKIPEQSS